MAAKSRKVPESTFYVDEISNHVPLQGAVQLWRVWSKVEVKERDLHVTHSSQNAQNIADFQSCGVFCFVFVFVF